MYVCDTCCNICIYYGIFLIITLLFYFILPLSNSFFGCGTTTTLLGTQIKILEIKKKNPRHTSFVEYSIRTDYQE